jgi:hypothetical protein
MYAASIAAARREGLGGARIAFVLVLGGDARCFDLPRVGHIHASGPV